MVVSYDKKYGWKGPIPLGALWLVLSGGLLSSFLPLVVIGRGWLEMLVAIFLTGSMFMVLWYNAKPRSLYWWQNTTGEWRGSIVCPKSDGILIHIPWTGWDNSFWISYDGWRYNRVRNTFCREQESLCYDDFVGRMGKLTKRLLSVEDINGLLVVREPIQFRRIRAIERGTVVEVMIRNRQIYRFRDPDQFLFFLLGGEVQFIGVQDHWWKARQLLENARLEISEWFPGMFIPQSRTENTLEVLVQHLVAISRLAFDQRNDEVGKSEFDYIRSPYRALVGFLDDRRQARNWIDKHAPKYTTRPTVDALSYLEQSRLAAAGMVGGICLILLEARRDIQVSRRNANRPEMKRLLAMIVVLAADFLPANHESRTRFAITPEVVAEAKDFLAATPVTAPVPTTFPPEVPPAG